jgi:hypothetical protein
MNGRGQAIIESLFPLPLMTAAFSFFLILAYSAFASAWIGYQLDQSLFCLAEGRPQRTCSDQLRTRLHRALPLGDVKDLKIEEMKTDQWRGLVEWEWMHRKISKKKVLRWGSSVWRS